MVDAGGFGGEALLGIEVAQHIQFVGAGDTGADRRFEDDDRFQFPVLGEQDFGVGEPEVGLGRILLDQVLHQRLGVSELPVVELKKK